MISIKRKQKGTRRCCFAGFFLTLLLCSAPVFTGIAWQNTATALHGEQSLLAVKLISAPEPQLSLRLPDSLITVDLSALNTATEYLQKYEEALPYPIRMVILFFSGIRLGIDRLF